MRERPTWTVDWWNEHVPEGTEVLYWPIWPKDSILREWEARRTKTRSCAWALGDGRPIVLVEGQSGGVAIGHCAPRCCDGSGCLRCSGQGWDRPPAATDLVLGDKKPPESKYPECEKLSAVSADSNKIGAFLDWLVYDKGIYLAEYSELDELWAINTPFERLLAEYFEIDLDKVEDERRAMLEGLRNAPMADL